MTALRNPYSLELKQLKGKATCIRSFVFLHFLYLTEEMGWVYFKTYLTVSERQLENSYYYSVLMLKFH